MRVRIKSATRVNGQHLAEGKIVAVSDEDAYILFAANKAERVIDPPKPAPVAAKDPAASEPGEPE